MNDGSQSFVQRILTNSRDVVSVFATDVNADGFVDVVVAAGGNSVVSWFQNDGSESFSENIISSTATGAYSVFAVDVSGSGSTDVIFAAYSINTVAVCLNDGSESFSEHVITSTAVGAYSVYASDANGDGSVDVPGPRRVINSGLRRRRGHACVRLFVGSPAHRRTNAQVFAGSQGDR